MRRGDVVTVATGSGFGGKPRPALVIQANEYGELSTVIVALMTSTLGETRFNRPHILPDTENGLRDPSDVMIDILVTAPREKIGGIIGRLTQQSMAEIDQGLLLFLGLA